MVDILHWNEIRRSGHYEEEHYQTLDWDSVVRIIIYTKNKRKIGNKIKFENNKFYILCELKEDILYVINVKRK